MKKYIWGGAVLVIVATAVVLFISQKDPESVTVEANTSKITILVPQNIDNYKASIDNCAGEQACRDVAVTASQFMSKELTIPYTEDVIKASALAAANLIPTQAGTLSAAYWKIQNNTVFLLLNIHLDGWAGVSMSLARIEPIIEKTLLQFPEVKQVVFGYAPGDSR